MPPWENYCLPSNDAPFPCRLGELFRAAILINFSRTVRVEVRLLGRILPALASICLTALLFLLLFAWAGTIIFDADSAEGQIYFPNLGVRFLLLYFS